MKPRMARRKNDWRQIPVAEGVSTSEERIAVELVGVELIAGHLHDAGRRTTYPALGFSQQQSEDLVGQSGPLGPTRIAAPTEQESKFARRGC